MTWDRKDKIGRCVAYVVKCWLRQREMFSCENVKFLLVQK